MGKLVSCFNDRYAKNYYTDNNLVSIGIFREIMTLKIKESYYRLTIWVPPGLNRFKGMARNYYKNVDGALILFYVNDNYSFNNVVNWMTEIKLYSDRIIPIYMIGNKIDIDGEKITKEEKKKLAQELDVKYFEISNKLNLNVHEVYYRQSHIEDGRYEKILGWDIFEDEYILEYKPKTFEKLDKYINF